MEKELFFAKYASPIGALTAIATRDGICGLLHGCVSTKGMAEKKESFRGLFKQLDAYFSGKAVSFDVSLDLHGSPFELKVWNALKSIHYGETLSYKEVAERIGRPKAARAVGGACGRNPVPIIIPCHRVLAADRKIGGFSIGTDKKLKLLALEGISVK